MSFLSRLGQVSVVGVVKKGPQHQALMPGGLGHADFRAAGEVDQRTSNCQRAVRGHVLKRPFCMGLTLESKGS